jgi:hypothetical protein
MTRAVSCSFSSPLASSNDEDEMMPDMRSIRRLIAFATVLTASMSCGDVVRQGRSPVFLTIDDLKASPGNETTFSDTLLSDVDTNGTIFNDVGRVTLSLTPKDFTVAPTTNNQVTIRRYRVVYRRADGRNTPGLDVPYGFDGGVTGTVPPSGTLTLEFELVRHVAKGQPPLLVLSENPVVISSIAEVTFYGTDQVGNAISVTGSILIDFGNFAD